MGSVVTALLEEDEQTMPAKYDESTKAKAVRHRDDYDSE